MWIAVAAMLLVLPGTADRPHDHTVANANGTLTAFNMGDQVQFVFSPDDRAARYELQVAPSTKGR